MWRACSLALAQEAGSCRENDGGLLVDGALQGTRHRTCAASMTSRPAGMPMSLREDMGIIIQQGTGTARDSTRLDGRRLGQTDISGSRSKNSKRACQVSGGKGYLLQETQDVGALECRPFETPPLRVEDVAGHGTGVGSMAMEVFASAAAAVSAMPLLSPSALNSLKSGPVAN